MFSRPTEDQELVHPNLTLGVLADKQAAELKKLPLNSIERVRRVAEAGRSFLSSLSSIVNISSSSMAGSSIFKVAFD